MLLITMVVSYLLHKWGDVVPGLRRRKMQNNKQTRSPWCFAWLGRKLNPKTEQSARRWGGGGQEEQNADLAREAWCKPGVGSVLREDSILTGRCISACLLVPIACHQFMSSTPTVYLAPVELRPLLAVGPKWGERDLSWVGFHVVEAKEDWWDLPARY